MASARTPRGRGSLQVDRAHRTSPWRRCGEIFAAARIKPASVQVECHPYFPQWDLLDFCREHGIVVQAGAPLAHASSPRIVDDPVIKGIAERVHKTPAQVALAWAVQRGTAVLMSSTKPDRIRENFEISALPEEAMREIRDNITTNIRFNPVVETGVPGFIRANEERAEAAARPASPAAVGDRDRRSNSVDHGKLSFTGCGLRRQLSEDRRHEFGHPPVERHLEHSACS